MDVLPFITSKMSQFFILIQKWVLTAPIAQRHPVSRSNRGNRSNRATLPPCR